MTSRPSQYWKTVLRNYIGDQLSSISSLPDSKHSLIDFGNRVHVTEFLTYILKQHSRQDRSSATFNENLQEARLATLFRNSAYKKLIQKITDRAERNDLRHCWLKGAALLLKDRYPPGVRRLSDLDLLIEREELEEWCNIFRKMGFKTHRSLEWINKSNHSAFVSSTFFDGGKSIEIRLDVHWHLVDFPARRAVGDWNWSMEPVWSRHEEHMLCPEHRLLYQADHAFSHSYRRWKWAIDLYYLEQKNDLNYDFIWTVAERWNIRPILGMTKLFVDDLLSVEWLQPLKKLENPTVDANQSRFVQSGLEGTNRKADYLRICASLLDGYEDKLRFWRWILVPPLSALSDLPRQPGYFKSLTIYLHRFLTVAKGGIKTYARSWGSYIERIIHNRKPFD